MNQQKTEQKTIYEVIKIKSEYARLRIQFQEMAFDAKERDALETDEIG